MVGMMALTRIHVARLPCMAGVVRTPAPSFSSGMPGNAIMHELACLVQIHCELTIREFMQMPRTALRGHLQRCQTTFLCKSSWGRRISCRKSREQAHRKLMGGP